MARGGFDPFVERVREATDIVEVIGGQVQLKKMGARLGGLCPFHKEKTPSFYVNPSMQAYHCFGCGAGGDVFTFLMQHEKMTFPEALRYLAERAGIPLPEKRGPAGDALQRIREALTAARSWYRGQLAGPAGAEGRAYLDRRGIGPEMRERYGLGYVGDQWDGLVRHARNLISERTLIEAGLAAESSGGRVYDRFRHRLMVPIEAASGAPVGFGGRALGDQEPKYLNSPETPVYRKGAVLFGVPAAREGIRFEGRVVVVEGYFDVIALVQAGIAGVVGTCGTALTPEQAGLLRRLSDRVVLLFDGDAAGHAAALRALPVVASEVGEILVANPPAGKDPDLWVRETGPEAVRAALASARGPLAYLHDLIASGELGRREAAANAAEVIARIADPLNRDLWVEEAASRFGIRAEAFLQAIRQRSQASPGSRGGIGEHEMPRRTAGGGDPHPEPGGGAGRGGSAGRAAGGGTAPVLSAFEKECLRSALAHPSRAGEMAAALEQAAARETALARWLRWIAEREPESGDAAALLSRAARELPESAELTAILLAEAGPPEDPQAILGKIAQRGLRRRMEELSREIRRAQEGGNPEELTRFLIEKDRLAREQALLARSLSAGARPDSETGGEKRAGQTGEDLP